MGELFSWWVLGGAVVTSKRVADFCYHGFMRHSFLAPILATLFFFFSSSQAWALNSTCHQTQSPIMTDLSAANGSAAHGHAGHASTKAHSMPADFHHSDSTHHESKFSSTNGGAHECGNCASCCLMTMVLGKTELRYLLNAVLSYRSAANLMAPPNASLPGIFKPPRILL